MKVSLQFCALCVFQPTVFTEVFIIQYTVNVYRSGRHLTVDSGIYMHD